MSKKKHTPRQQNPASKPDTEKLTGSVTVTKKAEVPQPEPKPEPAAPDETSLPETAESGQQTAAEPKSDTAEPQSNAPEAPAEDEYTLQTLVNDVKAMLGRYDLPNMLLTRCIALYFLLSGFWVLYIRNKLDYKPVDQWREFVGAVSGKGMVVCSLIFLAASFVTLSCIHNILPKKARIVDQSLAIGSVLFFDVAMLWRVNNFFMTAAVAFVSLVFIYYVLVKLPSRKPFEKVPWQIGGIIALIATICVTVFIAEATVAKHKIFGTACHDFGLFVQMYHSLSNSIHAITTCERDTPLSHFYIHASYIYYLLVPFYKIVPKESTLLIGQAILAMGGAVPMFLIAKRHNVKGIALIFLTFAYTFSISVISPCFYDFHENAFLPTLLMWLFYAIDSKNTILMWVMTVLVCIVKEDAPLYTVCIGLFIFFEMKGDKKRWQGLLMTALSGIYMVFITSWLTKNGDGSTMTSIRFGNLMINPDGGLGEVVKNVLLDPSYFFSLLIHENTLDFFLKVMLPLLFIPFLTKKIHRFWLMIPFLIMNMTVGAGYGYAASIDFHYIFGPICLLLYMVIINLEDFGEEKKHDLSILLGASAIIFFVGLPLHHWDLVENYEVSKDGFQAVEECLDRLPQDATVCATAFFVSHCADREAIYLFDFNDVNRDEGYMLEPDRYDFYVFGPGSELGDVVTPILEQLGWTAVDEVPNRVIVYQSPNYQGSYPG